MVVFVGQCPTYIGVMLLGFVLLCFMQGGHCPPFGSCGGGIRRTMPDLRWCDFTWPCVVVFYVGWALSTIRCDLRRPIVVFALPF